MKFSGKTLGGLILAITLSPACLRSVLAQLPDPSPTPVTEEMEGTPEKGAENASQLQIEDPTSTAGGALRFFMNSRDYRTLKRLKSVMTDRLIARFDHDSAPFNGKRANRIAAFDFTERDLKPPRSASKSGPTTPTYVATVRSLWEEQGEASEKRTEAITIVQREDGLWRIADLQVTSSEKLRFAETVNGVTVLRMVLRAWHRGDPAAARANLSESFLKKVNGDGLPALFVPAPPHRHAAYQIIELTPHGTTGASARVRLYETVSGEPGTIEGQSRTLKLVRKGSRWVLESWE